MKKRAVFLDRDGVINRYSYKAEFGTVDTPANPAEFHLLPGAGEAIAALNQLGLLVIVVSNQPGIAKGKLTPQLLGAINEEMRMQLAGAGAYIDAAYFCLHHPDAVVAAYRSDCDCRKPKPGLLLRAAREHNLDLGESFFIGDDVPDILAGRAAGVTTILLAPPLHRVPGVCFAWRDSYLLVQDLNQAAIAVREMLSNPKRTAAAPSRIEPCVLAGRNQPTRTNIFAKPSKSPRKSTRTRSSAPRIFCALYVSAVDASFFWESAAELATLPTRPAISAKSPASRPIPSPTTFPNSPRASTMKAGTPLTGKAVREPGSARTNAGFVSSVGGAIWKEHQRELFVPSNMRAASALPSLASSAATAADTAQARMPRGFASPTPRPSRRTRNLFKFSRLHPSARTPRSRSSKRTGIGRRAFALGPGNRRAVR